MMPRLPSKRVGLPLALQMIAILVCALVAAQLVTLLLTVLLPPRPTARWDIEEVVTALGRGEVPPSLERKAMAGPPDISGQGWLVSESSREALARRLDLGRGDVVLAFYTQLPVGGVAVPTNTHSPLAVMSAHRTPDLSSILIESAQAQTIPGGPPPGGNAGPSGMPGGVFPGGMPPGASPGRLPGGMPPGGQMPGGSRPASTRPGGAMPGGAMPSAAPRGAKPGGTIPGGSAPGGKAPAGLANSGPSTGNPASTPAAGTGQGPVVTTPGAGLVNAGAPPPTVGGIRPGNDGLIGNFPQSGPQGGPQNGMAAPTTNRLSGSALPARRPTSITPSREHAIGTQASSAYRNAGDRSTSGTAATSSSVVATGLPAPVSTDTPKSVASAAPPLGSETNGEAQPIPFRREHVSLFDVASPPFIEGDFVAAARQSDGQWLAVAPREEPFPNAWQQRVMLWFALSLAIISPFAWLFARRIVVPLRDFARAAEQLGRDPSATILPLSGPAEIGRAANAFNQMRNRLRAFVDDRTAMVGAISHDLRTPLTRLRFRIEDVPDEQRDGLLKEVTEMEAMISQVITFIRDASTPGARKRIDFAELIESSVEDARLVGGDILIDRNAHIPVDVDPVGMRRLLGNLLENAMKYGDRPHVRVSLRDGEAIAEIIDNGPGIPEEEFDRVFEPFYRSESARKSGKKGSGLGLAVCRSIARAHGGDVTFEHGKDGFVARVQLPAAFSAKPSKAA